MTGRPTFTSSRYITAIKLSTCTDTKCTFAHSANRGEWGGSDDSGNSSSWNNLALGPRRTQSYELGCVRGAFRPERADGRQLDGRPLSEPIVPQQLTEVTRAGLEPATY